MALTRRKVANFLIRFPWVNTLAQRAYRVFLPWRTVGAAGVVFNREGQVLVVEHVFHPTFPWGLPGGWMDRGEDPADTVRREIAEETGLTIDIIAPILIEHPPYLRSHLDVAFLCVATNDSAGHIRLSSELLDYRWIDPTGDAMPLKRFHRRAIAAAVHFRSHMQGS